MTTLLKRAGFTLSEWQHHYPSSAGGASPASARHDRALVAIWIRATAPGSARRGSASEYRQLAQELEAVAGVSSRLPLFGVPFAIKDNIGGGWPTSASARRSPIRPRRTPPWSPACTARRPGAIALSKTNLDQFATGLVGTRSPYGAVVNSFDSRYVSGGSSSGSASVVARGLVPFALGTDTAGSGRVPAGFNNIVGLKPTKGGCPTAAWCRPAG
ncbi:amidase family protein [Serratia ureilytica]